MTDQTPMYLDSKSGTDYDETNEPSKWVGRSLIFEAIASGEGCVIDQYLSNYDFIDPKMSTQVALEKFGTALNLKPVLKRQDTTLLVAQGKPRWTWTGLISLRLKDDGGEKVADLDMITNSEAFAADVVKTFNSIFSPPKPQKPEPARITALVRDSNKNLTTTTLGTVGIALERGNYSAEILSKYDKVAKDLMSDRPRGRIALFSGEPGTGKTFLVRGLIHETWQKADFIMVSPQLVPDLAGPDILPVLLRLRAAQYHGAKPLVLVLEDADSTLVSRSTTNMSSIQALLNLGDGILGSCLDIRIVATTNATTIEMDPAITRPGRLSQHVHVGALSFEEAAVAFKRLSGKTLSDLTGKGLAKAKMTIAEVYDLSRQDI